MKQAARPPMSEMTRPISGMVRARMSVRQNQTTVHRTRRLRSLTTSVSTSVPLKRSHKPSNTALKHTHTHTHTFTYLSFTIHLCSHPPSIHSSVLPPTEVQYGIWSDHADDDEGSGDGHSDIFRWVWQQHILIHHGPERQETAHTCEWKGGKKIKADLFLV